MVRWQRDCGRPRLTLVPLLGVLDPNRIARNDLSDPPTCDRKRDCGPSWNEFLIFLYVERHVFTAIFGAVERLLRSWNIEKDGVVDAYALKELKIGSECLASLTNGLHNVQRVHEIVRVTVMKYWYDVDWPEPHDLDTVLAEYSLDVPFRVQWSVGAEIVDVQVLPLSFC